MTFANCACLPKLVFDTDMQGERFVVKAMAAAAANSTRAYMDTLGAGNTYDDIFAAAFAPSHREVCHQPATSCSNSNDPRRARV